MSKFGEILWHETESASYEEIHPSDRQANFGVGAGILEDIWR